MLRVLAHVPSSTGSYDLTGLRVLLTADLLVRAAELGRSGLTAWTFADRSDDQVAAIERASESLGIRPPTVPADAASLGGRVDVHVTTDDQAAGSGVRVAGAYLHDEEARVLAGQEPLSVRLALLACPPARPADLTADTLTNTGTTLGQWRRLVARWAESPSRPVPENIRTTVRAAFDNLELVSVLTLLGGLAADDDVPAGARFETFVYADRVLGLDLSRDIGRV